MSAATRTTTVKPLLILAPVLIVALLVGAFLYGRDRVDGEGTAVGEYDGPTTNDPGHVGAEQPIDNELEPRLMVDGESVFAHLEEFETLVPFIGQEVQGENLRVLNKVNDTTYWVGDEAGQVQVLVTLNTSDPSTRTRGNLSGDVLDPEENTLVELRGRFVAVPEDLLLDDEEQAALLREQGAYIFASIFNIDS